MVKRIKVRVAKDGKVTIEAVGYSGDACLRATKPLEEALGLREESRRFKPERLNLEQNQKGEVPQW